MQTLRITGSLGPDDLAERYTAIGAGPLEVRIVPAGPEAEDAWARVRDAAAFAERHADALGLLTVPVGELECAFGCGLVTRAVSGVPLAEISGRTPPPVVLWLAARLGRFLADLDGLRDPVTGGRLHATLRSLDARHVCVAPEGALTVRGLDALWTGASDRLARTTVARLRPGARLAPEQEAGHDEPLTALWLLGLLLAERVCRRSELRDGRPAFRCDDAASWDAAWRSTLHDSEIDAETADLLQGALRHDLRERSSIGAFAERAEALWAGVSPDGGLALEAWLAAAPTPAPAEWAGALQDLDLEYRPLERAAAPVHARVWVPAVSQASSTRAFLAGSASGATPDLPRSGEQLPEASLLPAPFAPVRAPPRRPPLAISPPCRMYAPPVTTIRSPRSTAPRPISTGPLPVEGPFDRFRPSPTTRIWRAAGREERARNAAAVLVVIATLALGAAFVSVLAAG